MNASEARKQILDVLLGVDLISAGQRQRFLDEPAKDIRLADLGIDSMKVVDLCLGLEERVGREISIEELVENPTVNKLAGHLAKALDVLEGLLHADLEGAVDRGVVGGRPGADGQLAETGDVFLLLQLEVGHGL